MTPMRLEVDSGAPVVVASFTITNNFTFQDRFAIDCFKGEVGGERIQCESMPAAIILSPNRSRKVKVRMPVSGDGAYKICSIEDPAENEERQFITRMCATVGVGVDPNERPSKRPQHRSATDAMAARARQNPVK